LKKMVLGAGNVPDGIANPILTVARAGEPLFFGEITCVIMYDAVQIGELSFEISADVHGFLPSVRSLWKQPAKNKFSYSK